MKQHITKEQWDELSDRQVQDLINDLHYEPTVPFKLITIGQMIEFLGDDWWNLIEARYYNDNPFILCDALWAAVKYKLNNL